MLVPKALLSDCHPALKELSPRTPEVAKCNPLCLQSPERGSSFFDVTQQKGAALLKAATHGA